VPYRTKRAFREQLYVLELLSQREEAEARAAGAAGWRAKRARRRLAAISEALAARLAESSLRQVAVEELLPDVRAFLEGAPAEAEPPVSAPATHLRVRVTVAATCAASWAVTITQVGSSGISNRPDLIAPEVVALVLTPLAVLLRLLYGDSDS
jgi:hypothetical protein